MAQLAYLVSQYPAISHALVLGQVHRLRRLGLAIHVASIDDPDRPPVELTEAEREEADSTYYVKRQGVTGALAAQLATLRARPVAWCRGLAATLWLSGADLKMLAYNLKSFLDAGTIGRWMRERGLSHLHVPLAAPCSTAGLIASRIFPITMSMMVHGPDEFSDVSRHRLAEKISGSRFICCTGTYTRSQLMALSTFAAWERIEVSPPGVDTSALTPRQFREEPNPFEVICVGPLVPAKGQHVLVAAVARIVRAGREIRLRIVGDGPDRRSLDEDVTARGLQGQVVFEGTVGDERIHTLYAEADAFVLASFAEGIPMVLMEAMASELPCVATLTGGISELIRHGVDGLLAPPSDDEAFARALGNLMDDVALRRGLGIAGRRRVIEKYDLTRNLERLAEIFQRRVGETP